MVTPHLIAVPNPSDGAPAGAAEVHDLGRVVETGAERIRRLQHEARTLAREQVEIFARELMALAQQASDIAEGGDAYPVGVREMASRFVGEATQRAQAITTILSRIA
jgi:hypothetical protein